MNFKNPWIWDKPAAKARHELHVHEFLQMMNSEAGAKRVAKRLETLRDQCRDLGQRRAADCFDTALEATEEALGYLGREKKS